MRRWQGGGPAPAGEREPLWTASYVLLLICMHLYFASFFSTYTTIPLYLEDAEKWEIGLVVGSMGVFGMVVRPLAGLWVDRYGRRGLMIAGAGATAFCLAAYALTDNPYLLLPLRLANGVSMVLFTTAAVTMAADIVPADRRGMAMGYWGMMNSLSQVYAPWLGLAIAKTWGFTPYFLVAAAASGLAFLFASRIEEGSRPPGTGAARQFSAAALISRSALLPASAFLTITVSFGALQGFLPLLAEDRDLGNPGLFFVLYGAVIVPLRPLAGALADRYGRAGVVVPGLVLGGLAMALLAVASVQGMMLAAAVVFGFAFAGVHTGLLALTVDRAGSQERGVAMSTFALAWDLGAGVGAMVLGVVAAFASLGAVFAIAAALPLAGTILFTVSGGLSRPGRQEVAG